MVDFTPFYLLGIIAFTILLLVDIASIKRDKLYSLKNSAVKRIDLTGVKIKKSLGKKVGVLRRRVSNLNMETRNKSLIYKYLVFMSGVLTSLGLQTVTNPETILILIIISSITLGLVVTIQLAVILKLLTIVALIFTFHAVLAFCSRSATLHRTMSTMDAEDLLGSNMEDGIVESVTNNISSIDISIRPVFQDFLNNIKCNMSIEESIILLNIGLGPTMDSFCENALIHYKDNDEVVLSSFKDAIKRNSKKRILLLEQQVRYKQSMMIYFLSMGLTLLLGVIVAFILSDFVTYYTSIHGRSVTVLSIIISILGFVLSQIIYSGGVDR